MFNLNTVKMRTIRINKRITFLMKLENKLKKGGDIRKYNAIHSFNLRYFDELEREKQKNFKGIIPN